MVFSLIRQLANGMELCSRPERQVRTTLDVPLAPEEAATLLKDSPKGWGCEAWKITRGAPQKGDVVLLTSSYIFCFGEVEILGQQIGWNWYPSASPRTATVASWAAVPGVPRPRRQRVSSWWRMARHLTPLSSVAPIPVRRSKPFSMQCQAESDLRSSLNKLIKLKEVL